MSPDLTIPRALRNTLSASTRDPQQFQLFHPIGGVSAISSPTTIRNFLLSDPLLFFAFNVVVYSPVLFNTPVICPFFESNCNPAGRCLAENSIGGSPLVGIL